MPGKLIRSPESWSGLARESARHQRRFQSTAILTGDTLGPVLEDEHQTLRLRKDGKALPLPPLLDPIVQAERSRWEQKKTKPQVNKLSPFQKKIWDNPYAHALASPVRQCKYTNALLPSDLLMSLHARTNPQTSALWLLPVSLTTKKPKQLGVPFRFLYRKLVVEELGRKRAWIGSLDRRFMQMVGSVQLQKTVWREDMPDFILSLMRKQLLDKLNWYFKEPKRLFPCASPLPEDISDVKDVSCILYLGTLKAAADELQAKALAISNQLESYAVAFADIMKDHLDPHRTKAVTHNSPSWWRGPVVPRLQPTLLYPPLEFKTTVWRGSRVPVYSLYDLLGEEQMRDLVQDSLFKDEKCLAVKRARHNVPLELLLMQMQAYLASPGP